MDEPAWDDNEGAREAKLTMTRRSLVRIVVVDYEDLARCPHCGNDLSAEDAAAARKPWWIIVGRCCSLRRLSVDSGLTYGGAALRLCVVTRTVDPTAGWGRVSCGGTMASEGNVDLSLPIFPSPSRLCEAIKKP